MIKIIEIDLDSKLEYLNKYDDNMISEELLNYVLDTFDNVKNNVVLQIKFNYNATNKELLKIENLMKKSFLIELDNIKKKLKKQRVIDLLLLLWGMLVLVIYFFMKNYEFVLLTELLMITSWVSLWKFVENILFDRRLLIIKKKKYEKLVNAKIELIN